MFAKRKARKIQMSEDNEEPSQAASAPEEPMNDAPNSNPTSVKFTKRPNKSSSLRKSINFNDDDHTARLGGATSTSAAADDDEDQGPAVIRPAASRAGSTKVKKKGSSSKLSFGVTEGSGASEDAAPFTPKKTATLSQRATENNALRSSLSSRKLPSRSFGPEQESTSYSREYLEELQSSTPNTPQNLASLRIHDDGDDAGLSRAGAGADADAMDIDPSELEGAVVVPQVDLPVSTLGGGNSHIPSATEIQAKKERRARLAQEGNAYDEDDDEDGNYISLSSGRKKEKESTRLIAEDEDLGEGYDEFVQDARLELGKRGEKEARRRHRREMEELINQAEGASEDEDEDSDAERKAAYEAAQTRAAMGVRFDDGAGGYDSKVAGGTGLVIPKMKPLPELGESLARMRELVTRMEEQVAAKRKRIESLEKEKQEILDEEKTVQDVLNQEGLKYQAALGIKKEEVDPLKLAAESPLRNPSAGRGLESFGTTPIRKQDEDEEMAD